ncbi:MAG TPA: FGGY-family carbohydrate kinase, partial [Acidimicrobiales bacterium]|nr:FGGY-family carbohydrate kinase [Acidimicrobiales bacterium]
MAEVTVGIDIGTTSVKAVAADQDGNVEARVRIPHRLAFPAADLMEHDADEAWRQGPLRALAALGRPDARAVAVSAMVPSMTAVDGEGHPVTPGLLYGDGRGRRAKFGEGADPSPIGEAAEFLRWTAAEEPSAGGFWSAPAVANYALGGEPVVDFGTAYTTTPLFSGQEWNEELCLDCGASLDRMPRVEMMGAAIGRVTGADTVLAAGSVDAVSEQLVAGADRDGDVLVLCGTTLIVWATIPERQQSPGLWTIPHTAPGKYQIGGASNAGGLFLNWADRLFGPADPASANPLRVPVWSPYVRGERTPFQDPDRRAGVDGLDLTHDAAALRRAAYEASGFVVRHLLDLADVPAHRIVATGGGTRLGPWLHAIADATGLPVEV